MPKQQIILITYGDDEEEWYLDHTHGWDIKAMVVGKDYRLTSPETLTLEQLANFCDSNAESRNNHSFVGAHRILAAFLHRRCGREQATRLFYELAEYGGLDGMSGCGGQPDAFADFGIEDEELEPDAFV